MMHPNNDENMITNEDDLSGGWITRKGKIVNVKRLDNLYVLADEVWDLNGNHLFDPSKDLVTKISGKEYGTDKRTKEIA